MTKKKRKVMFKATDSSQFDRNDIKLPDLDEEIARLDEQSKPTLELLKSDDVVEQAQLHWRLSPAFSVLVLFLLAMALSKTSHREAKFINLVVGVLAYAFLVNLITIGHSLLEQGELHVQVGLWWVYVLFIAYALWRIRALDGPALSSRQVARSR